MIYDRTFKQLITCVNSQIEELSEELEEPWYQGKLFLSWNFYMKRKKTFRKNSA
jgi:hypothetical protein